MDSPAALAPLMHPTQPPNHPAARPPLNPCPPTHPPIRPPAQEEQELVDRLWRGGVTSPGALARRAAAAGAGGVLRAARVASVAAEVEYRELMECTFTPNARGKPPPVAQPEVGAPCWGPPGRRPLAGGWAWAHCVPVQLGSLYSTIRAFQQPPPDQHRA
jgi:hypothetical protein